jgi:hypothetical protein
MTTITDNYCSYSSYLTESRVCECYSTHNNNNNNTIIAHRWFGTGKLLPAKEIRNLPREFVFSNCGTLNTSKSSERTVLKSDMFDSGSES